MFRNRSDEELVRLVQSPTDSLASQEAAARLLERHARKIYIWCRRYSRCEEEARDLAQEALLRVYTRLASFQGRARFTSWVFSITRNLCISHLRRSERVIVTDLDLDTVPDHGKGPENGVLEKLGEESLRQLVRDSLDPLEQDVIWLHCVERMSVGDVTEVLGLENATGARAVLQRARRKLRTVLEARDSASEEKGHG